MSRLRQQLPPNRQNNRSIRSKPIMPEENLTPAQQNLMAFLDKLASSPYSPELIAEGNEALDLAVEEHRRLEASIHQTSSALASHTAAASLDGEIQ
jgi:hypothetical protein